MSMKTDFYFLNVSHPSSLIFLTGSKLPGYTEVPTSSCLPIASLEKLSAAILGNPSVENLADTMNMAVNGSVLTSY